MDEQRVLIIAADPLARAGLVTLLADQPGWVVVGRISEDDDLLAGLEAYQPDVLLWDLGWQAERALEQLAELSESDLPIVALLPDETQANEAWVGGLRVLLLRSVSGEKLTAALRAATQELTVLDPTFINALLPINYPDQPPLIENLTPREVEVLQLLAEGLANKAIARKLDISDHTVKFHVNAILSKLGAQSRTEAVVRASRLGLILL